MSKLHYFVLLPLLAALSSGCATRYQDLLADRDKEIRQLEGQLADARAENEGLRNENRRLQDSGVAEASSPHDDAELARLQQENPDLDVHRDESGLISFGITNTVTFDSGSTQLKESAGGVLRQVVDVLQREFPGRRIYVEGHTDTEPLQRTKGTYRDNRHLSVERADAVARWLIERGGLPERRIAVVGYGPYKPRDPAASDAAKARNRRVEIVPGEPVD